MSSTLAPHAARKYDARADSVSLQVCAWKNVTVTVDTTFVSQWHYSLKNTIKQYHLLVDLASLLNILLIFKTFSLPKHKKTTTCQYDVKTYFKSGTKYYTLYWVHTTNFLDIKVLSLKLLTSKVATHKSVHTYSGVSNHIRWLDLLSG